jgi:purine-nucleoside phosphorylase
LKHLKEKVRETVSFLTSKTDRPPKTGVITGTGLSDAVGPLDDALILGYGDIPHFPVSTVVGHSGRLMVGTLAGQTVIVMQGRFHLYEGYAPTTVTFPVRVMQALGVRYLILSNAAGGMHPAFQSGGCDGHPRSHQSYGREPIDRRQRRFDWGPRFPDMTAAYDQALAPCCATSGCRQPGHRLSEKRGLCRTEGAVRWKHRRRSVICRIHRCRCGRFLDRNGKHRRRARRHACFGIVHDHQHQRSDHATACGRWTRSWRSPNAPPRYSTD